MSKLTVSVLGSDCPGIIATVSTLLQKAECNIINVSQTILAGEFASIYMVETPEKLSKQSLSEQVQNGLIEAKFDLFVVVRPSNSVTYSNSENAQPFVVAVDGLDQIGLISDMSNILFQHKVNIENMKAILGEDSESHAIFLFEIMVPNTTNLVQLRDSLTAQANTLNVRVSIQHRDIFEAIHRILPV